MKSIRNIVNKTLLQRTTEKDAILLEKAIYDCMLKIKDEYNIDDEKSEDFIELYKEHSYNFLGILMDENVNLKDCVSDLKENKTGWEFHVYSNLVAKKETENIRATRPTSITDGIHKCRRCNNKKIVHYSLQLRSGDEPMTHFFTCTQCGQKWRQG